MSHYNLSRKPSVNPQDGWADASWELTWAVEELSDRRDLIVKIAPDAGYDDSAYDMDGNLILDPMTGKPAVQQHAAITFLELGVIEINPEHLPKELQADPGDMHPYQSRLDRKRYPVIWGAAVHEAAHANHSEWVLEYNHRIDDGKVPAVQSPWAGAAMLLEESRIEKNQVANRPQDQPWIEAAAMAVAVEEYAKIAEALEQFMKENPQYNPDKLSRYKCGRAAALTLARVDAGSMFRNKEIKAVEGIVRSAFGSDYDKLRAIWLEAQDTADDDVDGMLDLGRRWYELTGDSGDDQQIMGVSVGSGEGSGKSDALGDALSKGASNAEKEASGEAEEEREQQRIAEQRAASRNEAAQRQDAKDQAQKTFGGSAGAPTGWRHPVRSTRNPTRDEVNLARATRIRLQNAYIPQLATVNVARVLPPGRLSTRSLQQRVAQRNMGMLPNVPPFKYTERKHTTTPPLKVGIVQDVSSSQSAAARAAVSGAWSLAKAANMIPDARVAMVTFGNDVHSIFKPLTRVDKVPVLDTNAGTAYFLEALKALEGELDLTRQDSARLVVILTDGQLNSADLKGRDAALSRLTRAGVKVLWLDTDGGPRYHPRKMPGLHISGKASGNYDVIPKVICHEAVTALTKGQ